MNLADQYNQAKELVTQANKNEYEGDIDRGSLLNEAKNRKCALKKAKQSTSLSLQQQFLKGRF